VTLGRWVFALRIRQRGIGTRYDQNGSIGRRLQTVLVRRVLIPVRIAQILPKNNENVITRAQIADLTDSPERRVCTAADIYLSSSDTRWRRTRVHSSI
jgi:hypothetical protein